jgi:hypothetical protein
VKILAERASKECSGNGDGYELLMDFYVREASWWSFTDQEKYIINRTAQRFRCALCTERFLDPCGRKRKNCLRRKV